MTLPVALAWGARCGVAGRTMGVPIRAGTSWAGSEGVHPPASMGRGEHHPGMGGPFPGSGWLCWICPLLAHHRLDPCSHCTRLGHSGGPLVRPPALMLLLRSPQARPCLTPCHGLTQG